MLVSLKFSHLLFRQNMSTSILRCCIHCSNYHFLCIFCSSFASLQSKFKSKWSRIVERNGWGIFIFSQAKNLLQKLTKIQKWFYLAQIFVAKFEDFVGHWNSPSQLNLSISSSWALSGRNSWNSECFLAWAGESLLSCASWRGRTSALASL